MVIIIYLAILAYTIIWLAIRCILIKKGMAPPFVERKRQ